MNSSAVQHLTACLYLTRTTAVLSDKDLGKCICASTGNEGLRRVERHVMNGLVVLLPMGRDLLHTRPVVQHPQAHRAVVAWVGGGQQCYEGQRLLENNAKESIILFYDLHLMHNFFCNTLRYCFTPDCSL